jgi:STE24 endopeptidase
MNFIAIIILLTLVLDLLLHLMSDALNLKMIQNKVPDPFKGIFDAERYARSQDYLKINTRFGWASTLFNTLVMLGFWFGGGFALLDNWARSLGQGPVVTGLIYIAVLMLAHALLSQPFSLYATFVIEERFGFNKTTLRTYVMDLFKGLVLAILLGTPLLAGILAFFEYAGKEAWLFCWAVVTLYMLFIQFVAPTWIMPLFNKFSPLEEGELRERILSYAQSIQYPLANVFVMDGSKRSGKSNAFFTGFGKNKRIVLFDTLIEQHTVDELLAVLAHEMGHYKKKHILQGMLIAVVQTGVMFFLLSFFVSYQGLFDAFFLEKASVYAGLVFFSLLYAPLDFFLGILAQMRSRKNEFQADRFSVETTGNPAAMVNALKKLAVHNLSNLVPHPFYVFLNYSHPPVLKRVAAIEDLKPVGSKSEPQ